MLVGQIFEEMKIVNAIFRTAGTTYGMAVIV